jgi:hypothetical protein
MSKSNSFQICAVEWVGLGLGCPSNGGNVQMNDFHGDSYS